MPPLNRPDVADTAPNGPTLTVYDEHHAVTYIRMLDAEKDGADWRDASQIVLRIDPEREPDRHAAHSIARAKWAARYGYRQLLQRGFAASRVGSRPGGPARECVQLLQMPKRGHPLLLRIGKQGDDDRRD